MPQQQQQQQPPNGMIQQQQQQSYGGGGGMQPNVQQPQGSITRFAPPSPQQQQPTSYAARSQQIYQSNAGAAVPDSNSFMARSQQAYSTSTPTNGMQYGASSQPAYTASAQYQQQPASQFATSSQQQQQPQQPMYASTASLAGSSVGANTVQQQPYSNISASMNNTGAPNTMQNQQQQQQPPSSQYNATASPGPAAGSFAARSQQSYGGSPQRPAHGTPGSHSMASPSFPQQQPMYGQQQQHQPHQAYASGPPRATPPVVGLESTQQQQRLLQDSTRKIQEHAYYMKQAMEQQEVRVVLDRACHMLGELGGPPHGQQVTSNTGNAALLTPKNYYELYMRALEDMPALEAYFLQDPSRMMELYHVCQYAPRVVSRLYLQIAAGAALVRSGGCGAHWMMHELQQAVKCEQNPVRGLFVRNFLLTALRDQLPDTPMLAQEEDTDQNAANDDNSVATNTPDDDAETVVEESAQGTVQESYKFILNNFMEMNKLWVRIQHLPGEGRNKDVRKRRERERNDLRLLIGSNLMRLSQLECVSSQLYGEKILPQILDHIVVAGDPLSQAYVMDCLVQVFPDEYHIETMQILLNVCPRLRDKVNIRTILQGLMDRLANYLIEEELLLDENDTNQVKKQLARDSFGLFQECVQRVYNARGPKLTSKEVIRLQTALLQFSLRSKDNPNRAEEIRQCINTCVTALRQANASYEMNAQGTLSASTTAMRPLDPVAVTELEKMLSIPVGRILEVENYSVLVGFLPWENRSQVAISLLQAGTTTTTAAETDQLFHLIAPLLTNGGDPEGLISKLLHQMDHANTDVVYQMLSVAKKHMEQQPLPALVYASLQLARRIVQEETAPKDVAVAKSEEQDEDANPKEETEPATQPSVDDNAPSTETDAEIEPVATAETEEDSTPAPPTEGLSEDADAEKKDEESPPEKASPSPPKEVPTLESLLPTPVEKEVTPRMVFAFVQETSLSISRSSRGKAFLMLLESALAADGFAQLNPEMELEYSPVALELFQQALSLHEEQTPETIDPASQYRNISAVAEAVLRMRSFSQDDYERIITKTAQFAARMMRKPEQCRLVALCAHLFFPAGNQHISYSNPQRALECLQRCLKLADSCTSVNPSHVSLFVELLEDYLVLFENGNSLVTASYISGLVALIKEHLNSASSLGSTREAKSHFGGTLDYIRAKKVDPSSAELFAEVQVE